MSWGLENRFRDNLKKCITSFVATGFFILLIWIYGYSKKNGQLVGKRGEGGIHYFN